MNPDLQSLHPYPFEKLAKLFAGLSVADKPHIALSIGEPQHPAPEFVQRVIADDVVHQAPVPGLAGLDPAGAEHEV